MTAAATTYDAILFASYGGPESQDEVIPFLRRATAGRDVPAERLEEVGAHYRALGGLSPINAQNRALTAALREDLAARGLALPVVLGNRNSPPFFADVLRDLYQAGHRRVLALATSAYSSYSSCRQYREDLAAALAQADLIDRLAVVKVRPFYDRAGFIAANAELITSALRTADPASTVIMFTTHSIPHSMAVTAGPSLATDVVANRYTRQHLEVAAACIAEAERALGFPPPRWRLVYQSRSGPPRVPWLAPDVNDAVREEAALGTRRALLAPIGFVSDHVEVIWDLDTEAQRTAQAVGIELIRVPTVGTHPLFVRGLADLLAAHLKAPGDHAAGGWREYCSQQCCLAPNRPGRPSSEPLPVVAGVSAS